MPDGFQIVAPRLLFSHVSRQTGVTGSSSQIFAFNERNVLALTVFEALSQTEVDHINIVLCQLSATEQEVIGFDVSVNNTFVMHLFNALDHLLSDHAAGLEVELPLTLHEEVF